MLEMASVIFPDYVSPLGSLYGFFWTIPEGSRVTSEHTAVSECASPLWNQWRLQNKPGQTSIPVILSAVAAPMTVQYIELAQRTHTQGHFNFLFPMKTLLKAHQLKLEDFFFFYLMGKQTKEFTVCGSGAMATASEHAVPERRAGVWGRLTHGGGAAGRLLLSLGLWLQDWYTTAFSPVPPASVQDHCHSAPLNPPSPGPLPHCVSWNFSHPCLPASNNRTG